MKTAEVLYDALKNARDLEASVKVMSDMDLRTLRGGLARGEFQDWPASMVHGVCILEGCRRFCERQDASPNGLAQDAPATHGEVAQ